MKTEKRYYFAVWMILFAIYQALVFTLRSRPIYGNSFEADFWISWGIVTAALIGQLFCTLYAFGTGDAGKTFLNISVIKESYTATGTMLVVGSIFILIPLFPVWIAALLCGITFGVSLILVMKAMAAASIVNELHENVKVKTAFIKEITAEAEGLMQRAATVEARTLLNKVCEALRYSDPMSAAGLSEIEGKIRDAFHLLVFAVKERKEELMAELTDQLLLLIADRARICKLYK